MENFIFWATFLLKELRKLAKNLPSQIKDANDMLNMIYNLNSNCIPENTFLICFPVFITNLRQKLSSFYLILD